MKKYMTIRQNLLKRFSLSAFDLCFTFVVFLIGFSVFLFLNFLSFTLHLMFFTSWVFCRHLSGRQKNEHFSLFRGRFGAGRFIQPAATVFGQFRLRVCFKNNLNCKFPPSLYLLPVSLWLLLLPWCFIYFIFSIFTWGKWGVEMRVPQLL